MPKCRSCHKSWLKFSPKYLNVIALFILSEISKSLLSIRKHPERCCKDTPLRDKEETVK